MYGLILAAVVGFGVLLSGRFVHERLTAGHFSGVYGVGSGVLA